MNLELPPASTAFVEDQVRRGAFSTPEDVVVAALESLRANYQFGDFGQGELDELLAEGERSGTERGWYARDDAQKELKVRLGQLRNDRT